jgi:hypothetical protein
MTDDLVKRLREDQPVTQDMGSTMQCALQDAAADRIEELEAKLDWVIVERDETFALMLDRAQTAEAKLAKAMEALEKVQTFVRELEPYADQGHVLVPALHDACTTLAELTGGKDE